MKKNHLVFAAIGIFVAALFAEIGLRIFHFSFRLEPAMIDFGFPSVQHRAQYYSFDPDLLWVRRDYSALKQFAQEHNPEIIFMGDSCTVPTTYPIKTANRLANSLQRHIEMSSFGEVGYSSQQGLNQFKRDIVKKLSPRVVVFYYGWNDHWKALYLRDRDIIDQVAFLDKFFYNLRIYQLFKKYSFTNASQSLKGKDAVRVPIQQYWNNIYDLAKAAQNAGIIPIFVTAGTSYEKGKEPEYLKDRFIDNLDDLIPLHNSYIQATRSAAQSAQALVCDFASEVADWSKKEKKARFVEDGIHHTELGTDELASIVSKCVLQVLH